jgi:HlyD family secretion protein
MQKLPANLQRRGPMVLAALALASALAWAMWPKAVGVDFAQVTRGPILVTVDEEGKTRIKDVYTVSSPIGGKLLRRTLEVGDRVKKDVTPVATIEPSAPPFLDVRTLRELEAQVEAGKAAVALAEAEVRQAESELEFAENELTRARALMRSKTISERTLERARIDADTRRAAVARAKSNREVRTRELDSAQARLIAPDEAWKGEVPVGCCVTVRSPVSGRVLRLIQESERVVLAGTPLVDIGDPENPELVVEYLSTDAVKVREGAKATVDGWGGPQLTAKVTRVEPAGFTKVSALGIEEQRVRIILALVNAGEAAGMLGHEFRVVVKIQIYESAKALRLPISALFRRGDRWAVFTVERGRARLAQVEIGQRNTAFAEVLRGLAEGAVVLMHPSDRIAEGVRVVRSNSEAAWGK